MKTLVTTCLLFCVLFFVSCKKDDANPGNNTELTFKGQLTNQLDGTPVSNVWVYVDFGRACCGGIDSLAGRDSTRTDAAGNYTINLVYPKPAELYRQIVYPNYPAIRFRPVYTYPAVGDWIMLDYDGPYAVPDDISIPVVDSSIITNHFTMLPTGIVNVHLDSPNIATTDTISFSVSTVDITTPNDNRIYGGAYLKNFYPTTWKFPAIANHKTVLTTFVRRLDYTLTQTDTFQLTQGQILDFNLAY